MRRSILCVVGALALAVVPMARAGAQENTTGGDAASSGAAADKTPAATTPKKKSSGGEASTKKSGPTAAVQSSSSDRAAAADQVSSLQADRAAIRQQVAAAKAARDLQYDKWAMTYLAMNEAKLQTDKAAMLAVEAMVKVERTQEKVTEYAIDAFINPPMIGSMAVLEVGDSEDASWAHDVMSITADEQSSVLDELADAQRSAKLRSERAERIAKEAADAESANKGELEAFEAQLQEQQRLDAQIDRRLDAALAEAAALREVDESAADQLAAEEQALADESKAAVGAAPAKPASSPSPSAPPASKPTNPGPTPTTTAKPKPPPNTPPPKPPSSVVTWSDVTKVGTFWVHKSIASKTQGLISAASAAGFSLSGGGFRDPAQQIQLRQAHCGTTYYDIYEKPASQCTPPTAIPGRSMHERGLALDIKSGGALISSRSDPAFAWLAANASRFGFYNLPSEPWHWSTNGT
ncbi:MAG: D-alanyl-D-alanine carboxypeptidase family protein [Microthrixaceae bacterium]